MSQQVEYTNYHPKWYRRRVSVWWWLESWPYTKFVLRELTSVAVAYTAVLMFWMAHAMRAGPEAFAQFRARMESPVLILVSILAFVLVLFHAVTWFNLAPKAMAVRIAGKRVPDWVIAGFNYVAWLTASAVVAWLTLRG